MVDAVIGSKTYGNHLGHLFLMIMRNNLDEINQIDAATGEKETNASVLYRSVRLAKCLRRFGLKPGDTVALSGRNHIHLHIPIFAAMLNGLPLGGVDHTFKYGEIYGNLELTRPKIVFCAYESSGDFERAAKDLDLDTKIVTFDKGDCTIEKFMNSYGEDGSLDGFQPASFDMDKIYLSLLSTGGTTGRSKVAAFKHKSWMDKSKLYVEMISLFENEKAKNPWASNIALNLSPVHWISGYANTFILAMISQCKLQTSKEHTPDHVIDIINKYKPKTVVLVPTLMASILNHEKNCDLTCFKVSLTGGQIYKDILAKLKSRVKEDTAIVVTYGQTESLGPCLAPVPTGPFGNCGKPMPGVEVKLVDPETGKDITEPNTPGELWNKGPGFTEYYNSPEETAKAFSEDGWYKTGDILYRDENDHYFFVERIKMIIKYRNQSVTPVELEEVIRAHPEVLDVAVTSIPHEEDEEHPVACVVKEPGAKVTADQIKELVADKLSSSKQLRGGVVFMDELPLTSTGKVARATLRKMVISAVRQ